GLALLSNFGWGQVNITPVRTDFTGFGDWTDNLTAGTTYVQVVANGAYTITPAMNFNNYSAETLNYKARTYGGANAAENTIKIDISINNGDDWTVLGEILPASSTMTAQTPIDLSSYNGTQVKIKFYEAGTSGSIGYGIDDISITGTPAPSVTVSTATLTGFGYTEGFGPSDEQSFTISGANLATDITITPSVSKSVPKYEISETSGSGFTTSPIVLTQSGGTVGETTIYVRLVEALTAGDYNDRVITASSAPADDKTVTCSGTVTAAASNYQVTFSVVGANGDISATVDATPIASTDMIDAGKDVVFTASPDGGYKVKEWKNNTVVVEGNTTNDYTLENLLAAANVTVEFEAIKYTVTFTVTDGTDPIEGAIVTVEGPGALTATNASGITTVDLANGTYNYTVTADGYYDYPDDFTVADDVLAVPVTMTLTPYLVNENFDYTLTTLLTANGYTAHSGTSNFITVTASTISYSGYASSGIGNEVSLIATGEDVNKTFTAQTSGDIYVALLVNVSSSSATGDYFFHLGPTVISTTYKGRLFAKIDGGNNLAFGIAHTGTAVYTDYLYDLNTTYLIAMKYSIVDGAANDVVSIIINPAFDETAPETGWLANTDVPTDPADIGCFALRQGTTANLVNAKVDGIRIATTWNEAVKYDATTLAPVATFSPLNNATEVAVDVAPSISFDVAIRNIDNSEITDANVDALITFKDALDADVTFDAVINAEKTLVTITPAADLEYGTVYTITLAPVEGVNNNASSVQSVSFTTKELHDVTFNVDLSNSGIGVIGNVYISGNFPTQNWVQPGDDPTLEMSLAAGADSIYTITLSLPASDYEYKYFHNAGWAGGDVGSNRSVTTLGEKTIDNVWGVNAHPVIGYCNLQWPENGSITLSDPFTVYGRVGVDLVTSAGLNTYEIIKVWVGYNSNNTNPNSWTNWVLASFNVNSDLNDEYMVDLGAEIAAPGTYYYATRFQFGSGDYYYGGYNTGAWDGTTNVSGVLSVDVTKFTGIGTWTGGNWSDGTPDGTQVARIEGTLTVDDIVSCYGMEIANNGAVTIATGKSLTLSNNLVIKSDADGTGSFIDVGGLIYSGKPVAPATVQLYLTQDQYWYVSSPINDGTSAIFDAVNTTDHHLYYRDEPNFEYVRITDNTTALDAMTGYAAKFTEADQTLEFAGTLNTGVIPIATLSRTTGVAFEGYNLVGNPYPSALDWGSNDELGWPNGWNFKTNIGPSIWIKQNGASNFAYYSASTGIGSPSNDVRYIAAMQSFWVRVSTVGTGTLTPNNDVRVHGSEIIGKSENTQQLIRLALTSNNVTDEAIVAFIEEATTGFDIYDT
ncbi:MAG: Ig-like domain-containing protein, partial [Bacteroidota bacterium]